MMGFLSGIPELTQLLGNSANAGTASTALKTQKAAQQGYGTVGGTASGLAGFGEGLLGMATKAGGLGLGADILGTVGTFAGTKLMNSLMGDSASKAEANTKAAQDAANAMLDTVAQNKSSLLQNTNAMGQQGQAAAQEAQRRMNSQMVGGDAVADKNRLLSNANSATSNAMTNASMFQRQSQMSQQNMRDAVRNMAGGSATSKLGNLAGLSQQNAQANLQGFQQGQQALSQANQQGMAANATASDIYNKDLASSFERNVKPALNSWENFQSLGGQLAGQAVGQTIANSNDSQNAMFNALQNSENNMAAASGANRKFEDYINLGAPSGIMNQVLSQLG